VKILYHHRTRAEDAQGVHIASIVRAFRSLGHEVDVVALVHREGGPRADVKPGPLDAMLRKMPAVVNELMQLGYNAYGYQALARALGQKRYDLIYERYSLNTLCGIWASRRFRVPLVLEVNSPLALEEKELGRVRLGALARRNERWVCSNSARTLAVTGVLRDILIGEGIPAGKVAVMPNGIDPDEFHPGISGDAVRERYGLAGKTVIGFIGWFRPWHGLELLVEAMADAGLGARGIRLLLIGDGPATPELRRLMRARGVEQDVIITGPIERADVAAHIAALDIAVQPHATSYASPMKLFEYMGMERCIVAPDQANIREILEDGKNARLFPAGDGARLVRVLEDLCARPEARQALAVAARRTLLERGYLWRSNAARTLELVFGGAGSPATGSS
jgi:glycosyltransferase involved in cell wall biosynthesis